MNINYNTIFCELSSKNIRIEHGNKLLKEGLLINWKNNPFFIELSIQTEKKEETIKIFYPFKTELHYDDDLLTEVYFDYRLATLNKLLKTELDEKTVSKFSVHKNLNTIISIVVNE